MSLRTAPSTRSDSHWPARIGTLCGDLRCASADTVRQRLRAELWLLLNLALRRFLSCHAARIGGVQAEDFQDIASQKALELLANAESGSWEPVGRSGSEVAGYLSAVAYNGLVDHARRSARWTGNGSTGRGPSPVSPEPTTDPEAIESPEAEPCSRVECREFVSDLGRCLSELQPRTRKIWFFRVFYDMSSKEIASHPDIGLKAPHVDVVLQRCRQIVRTCMRVKGHESAEMPPGAFIALWQSLGSMEPAPTPEESNGHDR